MDAIDYLIKHNLLKNRDDVGKPFALNLSRDTHIDSLNKIIQAMEEYAEERFEAGKDIVYLG